MTLPIETRRLLSLPPSWVQSLLETDADDPQGVVASIFSHCSVDDLVSGVHSVIDGGARTRYSFLFGAQRGKHVMLELTALFPPDIQRDLRFKIALSDSLYIPYDLRAAAFSWLQGDVEAGCDDLVSRIEGATIASPASYKDLLQSPSNDIDHNFDIPEGRSDRNRILLDASRTAMVRARSRLARRALGHSPSDPAASMPFAPSHIYVPEDALGVFGRAVEAPGIDWRDFIVDWNEILATSDGEQFTVAEILRLLLLDGEYHLPGDRQRAIADAVHMNILKMFCGATIGLKGGVIFVEHGFRPEGSYFLMCEKAILGKSCVVDATGVVVIEAGAFLGGGFSPILVHTHQHAKGGGSNERKRIVPTGFRAGAAARLPMEFVGLLEVAEMKNDHWRGIERIGISIQSRADVWEQPRNPSSA